MAAVWCRSLVGRVGQGCRWRGMPRTVPRFSSTASPVAAVDSTGNIWRITNGGDTLHITPSPHGLGSAGALLEDVWSVCARLTEVEGSRARWLPRLTSTPCLPAALPPCRPPSLSASSASPDQHTHPPTLLPSVPFPPSLLPSLPHPQVHGRRGCQPDVRGVRRSRRRLGDRRRPRLVHQPARDPTARPCSASAGRGRRRRCRPGRPGRPRDGVVRVQPGQHRRRLRAGPFAPAPVRPRRVCDAARHPPAAAAAVGRAHGRAAQRRAGAGGRARCGGCGRGRGRRGQHAGERLGTGPATPVWQPRHPCGRVQRHAVHERWCVCAGKRLGTVNLWPSRPLALYPFFPTAKRRFARDAMLLWPGSSRPVCSSARPPVSTHNTHTHTHTCARTCLPLPLQG